MTDARQDAIRDALMTFIRAFEQGDTAAMQRAFAADATSFPRTGAHRATLPHQGRRVDGIDPEMLAAVDAAKRNKSEPPYLSIEPVDLEIRISGDMAVASFHLVDNRELGRRTFVMAREDDGWKILHAHASNVALNPG